MLFREVILARLFLVFERFKLLRALKIGEKKKKKALKISSWLGVGKVKIWSDLRAAAQHQVTIDPKHKKVSVQLACEERKTHNSTTVSSPII